MSTPHTCPVCGGTGKTFCLLGVGTASNPEPEICPACGGACVVWEPETVCIPSVWIGAEKVSAPSITVSTEHPGTLWLDSDGNEIERPPS